MIFNLEQREFIQEMMFVLNQEEFLVLYLRFWRELDSLDISKLLNMSEKKVNQFSLSGVHSLKEMYESNYSNWVKNLKQRMLKL